MVEEGDCPTADEDSEMDSDSEVVWAKSAWGPWGLGHTFGDKLYFTRDIPEHKWIPKKLVAPTVPKPAPKPAPKRGKQPAAKPAAARSSIPVADREHVQLFKTMWDCKCPCSEEGAGRKLMNGCSALRLLLICIMRMAPSAVSRRAMPHGVPIGIIWPGDNSSTFPVDRISPGEILRSVFMTAKH